MFDNFDDKLVIGAIVNLKELGTHHAGSLLGCLKGILSEEKKAVVDLHTTVVVCHFIHQVEELAGIGVDLRPINCMLLDEASQALKSLFHCTVVYNDEAAVLAYCLHLLRSHCVEFQGLRLGLMAALEPL